MKEGVCNELVYPSLTTSGTSGTPERQERESIRNQLGRAIPAADTWTTGGATEKRVHAMYAHSLPFGKYKGQPLAAVPSGYLHWVLETCKLSSGLRAAIAAELETRGIAPPRCRRPRSPNAPVAPVSIASSGNKSPAAGDVFARSANADAICVSCLWPNRGAAWRTRTPAIRPSWTF
jgi:uncharacterized protein (DUF3820 family)